MSRFSRFWHGCWPQHPCIVPIPATGRREPLAENAAATQVALSADEVADLSTTEARIGVDGSRYTTSTWA